MTVKRFFFPLWERPENASREFCCLNGSGAVLEFFSALIIWRTQKKYGALIPFGIRAGHFFLVYQDQESPHFFSIRRGQNSWPHRIMSFWEFGGTAWKSEDVHRRFEQTLKQNANIHSASAYAPHRPTPPVGPPKPEVDAAGIFRQPGPGPEYQDVPNHAVSTIAPIPVFM